jgi:hypothetical protein
MGMGFGSSLQSRREKVGISRSTVDSRRAPTQLPNAQRPLETATHDERHLDLYGASAPPK